MAEEKVKRVKEWREREKARWDELVQPSTLFEAGLGPQPKGGDLGRAELEARRKAQEIEDRAILAKAAKFKEAQRDRPPQPIARERIRPRPRPLGEKDLSSFKPQPPPVDPIKEKAGKAVEALKKKKKKRSAPEEAADAFGAKRARAAPTEVEVPMAKDAPEVVEIIPTVEVVEIAPSVQVGAGSTEAVPSGMEQVQKRTDPQEGGVHLATAIYHARAVARRLEGEEGPARAGADRLVKIMEETALRAASGYNEADLLRGYAPPKWRIGDLLKELGEERARAKEEKGRLLRAWEIEKAKVVAELESLKKGVEEERATAAAERGALQRELDEKKAKAASEKAAYPDLCVAAVEQYKGSSEFQMVVDAAVARSLASQESGGWAHQGRLLEVGQR
ncbi:caldesmon-like [Camellia sinensis]|uniref:caldesmon-like n=1 Tax=Camellia sinensis TaxID=4442 RepID=UPI0010362146|nr:caldesmon-like [Camellia sinensis]